MGRGPSSIFTTEVISRLKKTVLENSCSPRAACEIIGINYKTFQYNATQDLRNELRELWKGTKAKPDEPKRSNRISDEQLTEIKRLLTEEGLSITGACTKLGIEYHHLYFGVTKEVIQDLRKLRFPVKTKRIADLAAPRPSAPITIPKNGNETGGENPLAAFPKVIFRISKNFIGVPSGTKARFFTRVEADVYYVVGYEYQLPNEHKHQVDINLHDYNTDLQTALQNLRNKIGKILEKDIADEVHGSVRYSLQDAAPYDPKTITVKTSINVPDGEYRCNIARDLGHLDHRGMPFQFVIPETLERRTNVPIVVKDNKGTIYL